MTPERWQQIKSAFEEIRELMPDLRTSRLSDLRAGDAEMHREVVALLDADREASGFLEQPPLNAVERAMDARLQLPSRIGPYRIVREIGRGGMGVVLLGSRDDDAYQKDVAIKVMRAGADAGLLRRFIDERRILAQLVHPNIAVLLDGGTTDKGQPFLVMEYVQGNTITTHSDDAGLSIEARLRLFLLVCDAVQHAHQRLVVHRDLKPANILVTAEGVPKLLDFGIAKLLAEGPGATVTMAQMLTPEYASPEQIRGGEITVATDVYALGVVLYCLLTGARPYAPKTDRPHDLARAICEDDPARPSTRRPMAADLDTIILKALQKDLNRRYSSVEAFAADIRRYLEGRPVLAHADSLAYRAAKFAGRHRAGVAAAATVALALLIGAAVSLWQWRIAETSRQRAQQRFDDVRALGNFVMFDMHDAIVKLPGSTSVRKELVEKVLQYVDRLGSEPVSDPVLLAEIARGYDRLARVQGHPQWANLGDHAGAERNMRKAIALREQLAAALPENPVSLAELAESYGALGRILERVGRSTEASAALDRMKATLDRVPSRHADDSVVLDALTVYYGSVAAGQTAMGNLDALRETRRRQVDAAQKLLARDPASVDRLRGLALAYKYHGKALQALQEWAAADDAYAAALDLDRRVVDSQPQNPHVRLDLAFTQASMASLRSDRGDLTGSVAAYRDAVRITQQVHAADPDNEFAMERLASFHAALGAVRTIVALKGTTPRARQREDWRAARENYSQALALRDALAKRQRPAPEAATILRQLQDGITTCDEALARLPRTSR